MSSLRTKKCDILICVYGYNTTSTESFESLVQVTEMLESNGFHGIVIGFDWPSKGEGTGYFEDLREARAASIKFIDDLMLPITRHFENKPVDVNIFGFSMGCYLIQHAFDDAEFHEGFAKNFSINQIIFAAADIRRRSFVKKQASYLFRKANRITIYHNQHDEVLDLSYRINKAADCFLCDQRRLGKFGLSKSIAKNIFGVDCSKYFIKKFAKSKFGPNSHNWYFQDKTFFLDMIYTLQGLEAAKMPTRKYKGRKGLILVAPENK